MFFLYRRSHETASAQCAVLTDFGSKLREEIRAANQKTPKTAEKRTKKEVLTQK